MSALPFTAAAVMVLLPGLVSLFRLLSDDAKVAMPEQQHSHGCRAHDRIKAAAQAITQANPVVVASV